MADALTTLLIAASRYGRSPVKGRSTNERLAFLQQLTALLARGVAERVQNLESKQAAVEFRKGLGKRGTEMKEHNYNQRR